MDSPAGRIVRSSNSRMHTPYSCEMERPSLGQRQLRPLVLPTIHESTEFRREEEYLFNSKLIKTRRKRNGYTKLTQRFEDDERSDEERPLLLIANQVHVDERNSKRAGGWKTKVKKRVKIAWPEGQRRQLLRARLRASVKALSPLFLLRTVRDAYVRALNHIGSKCNQRPWYSVGARAM